MKKLLIPALIMLLIFPFCALAGQGSGHGSDMDMSGSGHKMDQAAPVQVTGPDKYDQKERPGPYGDYNQRPAHDNAVMYKLMADRLEYQTREGDPAVVWDAEAWLGNDYHKLDIKTEGAYLTEGGRFEELELQAFYARTVSAFWNLRLGLRRDFEPHPGRTFAAVGLQGLAPQWLEVQATAYLNDHGEVTARLEVEYDLLLAQRLVLQPRLEAGLSAQEVEELGLGAGLNYLDLEARLRYEITRKVAPYIGLAWHRLIGRTASLAQDAGEPISQLSLVAGVRLWF